jgi:hypothetical protein
VDREATDALKFGIMGYGASSAAKPKWWLVSCERCDWNEEVQGTGADIRAAIEVHASNQHPDATVPQQFLDALAKLT